MKFHTRKLTQQGILAFTVAVILMVAALLMTLYEAKNNSIQEKSVTNSYASQGGWQAAQAGIDFGMVYLSQNATTILANPSNGYISYGPGNTSLTNVPLANGSHFSVVYSNPTINNFNVINVQSTGTSPDGTSTFTMNQKLYQDPKSFNCTVTSLGNVTLIGGSALTNKITNANICSAGSSTINNGGQTYTSTGSGDGGMCSHDTVVGTDIQQNLSSLQGMTESAFFQSIFGVTEATEMSLCQSAGNYYTNQGPDYSQLLSGAKNKTIWIQQTNGQMVTLGQGVTIGSLTQPVTLIVEGDLTIANGVTFYGFVYAGTSLTLAGGATIYGGVASGGPTNISNGVQIIYTAFPVLPGSGAYTKIPGGWIDF